MSFESVDPIVRTALYEGYVLYPYRATSIKNRQRFTFGSVFPRSWSEARRNGDRWWIKTECLVLGGERARLSIAARFLHLVERRGEPSATAWYEAVERTVEAPPLPLRDLLRDERTTRFTFEAAHGEEDGVTRRQETIAGEIAVRAEPAAPEAHRLRVEIRNVTPFDDGGSAPRVARDLALARSFASTHALIRARDGELVSLIDPPEALRGAAEACENVGAWPVLVGDPARRDTMLSSPIFLGDHPRIAPESPADLFDATEVDEILTLRILALTPEEKAEMRAVDPRARALLDRLSALGPEALSRLHGVTRRIEGVDLRPGDRVRLRPEGRADVFDIALAGMDATIASVERDYEGRVHFAVTIDADPGRDLGASGQPGHRFFFRREELVPR